MIDSNTAGNLMGATVVGSDDRKIGTVAQVYVDGTTQQPNWMTVRTGLFGNSESFVPLEAASFDNQEVRVPFDKDFVKDAPRIEEDGAISVEEENTLFAYYGNGGTTTGYADQDTTSGRAATDRPTEGHDLSGPNTDDAMTRSEEQLHVGTQKVESGRARLVKHVVTEQQSVTVPVTHEEVRLEREPITDANRGAATSGPDISDEEHEIVLTEERVVVSKETVPVERVRVGKESVTEQHEVNENVRKEQIDLIDPNTSGTIDSERSSDIKR